MMNKKPKTASKYKEVQNRAISQMAIKLQKPTMENGNYSGNRQREIDNHKKLSLSLKPGCCTLSCCN